MESVYWPKTDLMSGSWGTADNSYDAYNTYHLAVSIYEAHPRLQTIFDPTYFAVHHFNPNPELQGMAVGGELNLSEERYDESTWTDEWPAVGEVEVEDPLGAKLTLRYPIDITGDAQEGVESVCIREPSIAIATASQSPSPLEAGDLVFKDGHPREEENNLVYPLLPEIYSWMNTSRVGKLLPYSYRYFDVTFPAISGDIKGNYETFTLSRPNMIFSDDLPEGGKSALDLSTEGKEIIIGSAGVGYKVGDIVGDPESGLQFRVHSTGFNLGVIAELSFLKGNQALRPENISVNPNRFLNTQSVALPGSETLGVRLQTIQSENGQGFNMMFILGKVNRVRGVDQKPRFLARELQISADADFSPTDRDIDQFGVVDEEVTTKVEVFGSKNNQYDCFFHAHNDTMFTFFSGAEEAGYLNGTANPSPVDEQFIDLTILPE